MVVVPAVHNLFQNHGIFENLKFDTIMLIEGDFGAAAVLITFGALLGKVGPLHLIVIALIEIVVYAVNFNVVVKIGTLDVGGSLVIHMFGAYFGLAASWVLTDRKANPDDDKKNASS